MDSLPRRHYEAMWTVPTETSSVGAAFERQIAAALRPDLVTPQANTAKAIWRSPNAQRTASGA